MNETISQSAMNAMLVTIVALAVLPVIYIVFWKVKKGKEARFSVLLIGAAGFLVTVRVLELLVHMVCIVTDNPVSRFINGHTVVFVLYGICMAGIFEECGRYVIMKYLMKKKKTRENAVMYGIGHGGIEVWAVSLMAMVGYFSMAYMINTQGMDAVIAMSGGTEAAQASMNEMLGYISGFGMSTGILWVVERILCMGIHIALSVIVFYGVTREDKRMLPLAILAHALVDLLPALQQRGVVPMYAVEIWLAAGSVVLCIWAAGLYRKWGEAV